MIFMTGDTHADISRFNRQSFFEQKELTKDDYVIILGDFGMVWDWRGDSKYEKYWLDWLEDKPFTTLFIDGNHENHDRLHEMEVEEWHGGKVHKVRPSVLHLMRGQVFEIEGLRVFTFGGARSHDICDGILEPDDPRVEKWSRDYSKLFRVRGVSWWERELPTPEELEEGIKNLDKVNWEVDWVLTHCASASTTALISAGGYSQDYFTQYLEEIKVGLKYKRWFFGHHHMNQQVNDKEICLYEQIIRVH